MLGLIDDHQPIELVTAFAQADGEKAMAVIQSVAEKGVDWSQLLSDIAQTLHQIAMLQLLKNSGQEQTQLHFLAKQIAPEDVQFFYQLMLNGKKELEFAPEQRAGVEMTVLRALAFHPKRTEEINRQPVREVVQTTATVSHTPQQNIEQLKARLTQNHTPQAVNSAQNFATQPVAKMPENSTAYPQPAASIESGSVPMSPALAAMQARKQLQQTQAQLTQNEKKKSELAKPAIPSANRANPKKTPSLQERFMNLATEQQVQSQPQPTQQAAKPLSDEDYRWTWLNPELETQNESAKPSDIKQAILQERTPELVAKTIALSCEQDEWCRIVNELKLGGLSRQVALNSYLAEKQGDRLKLILKPAMAHLDNAESRQSLATALQEKGLSYELSIGESTEHKTPLEIRRAIFEHLTLEAKKALTNDEKLMLLRQTFDAEIDESTIRAVAENKE